MSRWGMWWLCVLGLAVVVASSHNNSANSKGSGVARPQYVFFTRPPGLHWSQGNPDSITPALLTSVTTQLGFNRSVDGTIVVGQEFIFSLLDGTPVDTIQQSVSKLLSVAASTGTPVSIVLDTENWWAGADLYNWWNASLPGFDPANVYNVEWTGPSPDTAVKIGWRDWGSQIRVPPQQNILSPKVLGVATAAVKAVSSVIGQWLNQQTPQTAALLGTVKCGWEAGVQYNAYYMQNGNSYVNQPPADDPVVHLNFSQGLAAGVPLLGYAARASAGLPSTGALTAKDVVTITQRYVETMAQAIADGGVPVGLIANHVGGQVPPYIAVPFDAAFVETGTPGWSFYWSPASEVSPLLEAMKAARRSRWAAAEWYLASSTADGWQSNFADTLRVRCCTHLSVYNWDGAFENDKNGQEGLRRLFGQANPTAAACGWGR